MPCPCARTGASSIRGVFCLKKDGVVIGTILTKSECLWYYEKRSPQYGPFSPTGINNLAGLYERGSVML